jgi:hypothetical protein
MSGISQIVNYYPTYNYLDNIISTAGATKINLFVDLKGCIQSLYQEWGIRYLLDQSKGTKFIDDSLFHSTLEFINWHKVYARKRGVQISIYFFFEKGKSLYHFSIYNEYKLDRLHSLTTVHSDGTVTVERKKISFLSDEEEKRFFDIVSRNLDLIENICNKLPNVFVIRLPYLEADFVPYYVRKIVLGSFEEKEIDVIYSLDKDMLQCLDNPNTYIFYKHYKSHKIINNKSAFNHFFKSDVLKPEVQNLSLEWFPLVLAIMGDSSDFIPGVKQVGIAYLKEHILDVINIVGKTTEEMYRRVSTGIDIFDKDIGTNNSKKLNLIINDSAIVARNLKLISYKLLTDNILGGFPAENIKRARYIDETVKNKNKLSNAAVLLSALRRNGLTSNIEEKTIYNIFL